MTNVSNEKWGGSGRPSRPASDGPGGRLLIAATQGSRRGY